MAEADIVSIGSTFHIARKAHTCQCGDPIRPGTRYQRVAERVDGAIEVTRIAEHIHSFEADEAAYNRKHNWF